MATLMDGHPYAVELTSWVENYEEIRLASVSGVMGEIVHELAPTRVPETLRLTYGDHKEW